MEHVTRKELNKILNGNLEAKRCPECGSGILRIIMPLSIFGRDGLKVECQHCGYGTGLQSIHTPIMDEKRFSFPITSKSIAKAIYKAVTAWNQRQPLPEVAANE